MDKELSSKKIKDQALELGFSACGIAEVGLLSDHEPRLQKWLNENRHGEMGYMVNHLEMRLDPTLLVENARSVIVVLQNYYPEKQLHPDSDYLISRYAYGEDYHFVIKDKLRKLQTFINNEIEPNHSRVFTDSAPVLERAWAVKAGLGWIGKNSLLITPRHGSYFFIAEIITDLELAYDNPYGGSFCGDCRRCIDACPTQAIGQDRMIDSGKCISYLTIEKKGELPEKFKGKYKKWIFGCDICQEVCPWNRFSTPHNESSFELPAQVQSFKAEDWKNLSKEAFNSLFKKSALKRAKYEGVMRNIEFLESDE
ncbi:MAG: tRNA epoxyqueuosine(34) reductase QueG [Bacteroidales bacterium]